VGGQSGGGAAQHSGTNKSKFELLLESKMSENTVLDEQVDQQELCYSKASINCSFKHIFNVVLLCCSLIEPKLFHMKGNE
jgi:hypothetical protein